MYICMNYLNISHKVFKVVRVYKYKNFILAVFNIVLLSFECFNNDKKLTIINFIMYFNENYLLGKKSY